MRTKNGSEEQMGKHDTSKLKVDIEKLCEGIKNSRDILRQKKQLEDIVTHLHRMQMARKEGHITERDLAREVAEMNDFLRHNGLPVLVRRMIPNDDTYYAQSMERSHSPYYEYYQFNPHKNEIEYITREKAPEVFSGLRDHFSPSDFPMPQVRYIDYIDVLLPEGMEGRPEDREEIYREFKDIVKNTSIGIFGVSSKEQVWRTGRGTRTRSSSSSPNFQTIPIPKTQVIIDDIEPVIIDKPSQEAQMNFNTNFTPMQASLALETCIKANVAAFLWGPPGVGKSSITHQVAKRMDRMIIDIRASQFDSVDFRGIPTVYKDKTIWLTPDFFPTKGEGILFLDELNQAPQSVQAACYQLCLDRKLGDYHLPKGWAVVAAGNRMEDRAIVQKMGSALKNRFIHIPFVVDSKDFDKWARSNGIRPEIIAFIRWKNGMLYNFDPKKDENAFATPRSWEFLSKLMMQGIPKEIEYSMVANTVGESAAAEFIGFINIFSKLPNIDECLKQPNMAKMPDDSMIAYALSAALADRVSEGTMPGLVAYAKRVGESLSREFDVLFITDAVDRKPDLKNTKAYVDWSIRNKDIM
jgi:hypothetical protein